MGVLAGPQHHLVLQPVDAVVQSLEGRLQALHQPFADVVGDEARPPLAREHLPAHAVDQDVVVVGVDVPDRDDPARAQEEPQLSAVAAACPPATGRAPVATIFRIRRVARCPADQLSAENSEM